jgi:hypothetical protein
VTVPAGRHSCPVREPIVFTAGHGDISCAGDTGMIGLSTRF